MRTFPMSLEFSRSQYLEGVSLATENKIVPRELMEDEKEHKERECNWTDNEQTYLSAVRGKKST